LPEDRTLTIFIPWVTRAASMMFAATLLALSSSAGARVGGDSLSTAPVSQREATSTQFGSDAQTAPDVNCTPHHDGFTLVTKSVELTVRNGAVTRLMNRRTGELHADGDPHSVFMPRGAICVDKGGAAFRQLHGPWSRHPIVADKLPSPIDALAHAPGANSTMSFERTPAGARCTWTGLEDSQGTHPADTMTLEATIELTSGFVDLIATTTSESGNLAGVIVPIVGLHPRHSLYLASFGGLVYRPADLASMQLHVLHSAPYLEAPVLAAEGERGCIALWMEDETFRPYVAMFGGTPRGFAIGIEGVGIMPFESSRVSRAVRWRIGAFEGSWPTAMLPYREWYAREFEPEIATRTSRSWPKSISVIVDAVDRSPESLIKLRTVFEPETVLVHEWQPRAAGFNDDLPDWTPTAGFLELVRSCAAVGFRSMGYVNSYCVSASSRAFEQNRIAEFGLTRRTPSLAAYGLKPQTFESTGKDEVLYLDPLSPRWRRFHVDQMIQWQRDTGADANYEDTGGTAGDFGNGMIGGIAGAQGGTTQFRELLDRHPVPVATEFAPDHMAFASNWAMRYSQVWGNADIRRGWESRHRPITPLLFSGAGRAWVPTVAAESEDLKWTVTACSDALGGVAQLAASEVTFTARTGLARHMLHRAVVFSRLALKPTFDDWPRDPTVAAQYRAKDGRVYRYRVEDGLQELVGPDSIPIYQRVTGRASIESPLRVPGWPAWNGNRTFALQPGARYALGPASARGTIVQFEQCPSDSAITRYTETDSHVLVHFGPPSTPRTTPDAQARMLANADFTDVIIWDAAGTALRRDAPLRTGERMAFTVDGPCEMLLVRRTPERARHNRSLGMLSAGARFVAPNTGLERGGTMKPTSATELATPESPTPMRFQFAGNGNDSHTLYEALVLVPGTATSLAVRFRNSQSKFGDGSTVGVAVNGRVVRSLDVAPHTGSGDSLAWNTNLHSWRIPLGKYSGLPIVVSVFVANNGSDNADEIWINEPVLITDPDQNPTATSTPIAR